MLIQPPYNFSPSLLGVYLGYKTAALALVCLVIVLTPLSRGSRDYLLTWCGLVFLGLSFLLHVLVTWPGLLFLAATFSGLYGLTTVSLKSYLTRSVRETRIAQTLATVSPALTLHSKPQILQGFLRCM